VFHLPGRGGGGEREAGYGRKKTGLEQQRRKQMDLFIVRSQVEMFGGCKRVRFRWFRPEVRSSDRAYADLIKNYDPDDLYAKHFIDELFDAEEAQQLKVFLGRKKIFEGGATIAKTVIQKVQLPIASKSFPIGGLAVGGGDDFYMLEKVPGYSLPFRVRGYFNLVGCELLDGSDVYRHRLYFMDFIDNKLKFSMETNEEAASRERCMRPCKPNFPDVPF
jgi:hypothetical protein